MNNHFSTGEGTGSGSAHVDPNDKSNPAAWGYGGPDRRSEYTGEGAFTAWNELNQFPNGRPTAAQPAPARDADSGGAPERQSAPLTPAQQAQTPLPEESAGPGLTPLWIGVAIAAFIAIVVFAARA